MSEKLKDFTEANTGRDYTPTCMNCAAPLTDEEQELGLLCQVCEIDRVNGCLIIRKDV
jgi:hypothetical protein